MKSTWSPHVCIRSLWKTFAILTWLFALCQQQSFLEDKASLEVFFMIVFQTDQPVCVHSLARQRIQLCITSWYPKFIGSLFGMPPSSIYRTIGLGGKMVWTMTYVSLCAQALFEGIVSMQKAWACTVVQRFRRINSSRRQLSCTNCRISGEIRRTWELV